MLQDAVTRDLASTCQLADKPGSQVLPFNSTNQRATLCVCCMIYMVLNNGMYDMDAFSEGEIKSSKWMPTSVISASSLTSPHIHSSVFLSQSILGPSITPRVPRAKGESTRMYTIYLPHNALLEEKTNASLLPK